jgi:phosphocarrier protein HPr
MKWREHREPVTVRREVKIQNEMGLHARPAAQFVRRANAFRSEIWLVNKQGQRFSARNLIEVLRANLDRGASATLEAHGIDAEEAIDRLERMLADYVDEN